MPGDKHEESSDSEEWSSKQYSLRVTAREGFFCTIRLAAVLPLTPKQTFELLARPDSHHIFSSITDNTYRKILKSKDERRGQMRVETEALAKWRFALFRGKFATRLFVDLDPPAGTISFRLARPGMMKAFEGHWSVHPYDGRRSLDAIVSVPTSASLAEAARRAPPAAGKTAAGKDQPGALSLQSLRGWLPQPESQSSLVTLEQSLLPGIVPPGPIGKLVKNISAAQAEAGRINAGNPTPSTSSGLGDEFGFEGSGYGSSGGGKGGGSDTTAAEEADRQQSQLQSVGQILTANVARARARRRQWLRSVGLDPT